MLNINTISEVMKKNHLHAKKKKKRICYKYEQAYAGNSLVMGTCAHSNRRKRTSNEQGEPDLGGGQKWRDGGQKGGITGSGR